MVAAFPLDSDPGPVSVNDGVLRLHNFTDDDREVVAAVAEAEDPEAFVRQCLRVGARALQAVSATVDAQVVEKRFDEMSVRFDEQVGEAVAQILGVTNDLLDEENGALSTTLADYREQVEELLGSTFDPDSKKSVIGIIEKILGASQKEHVEAIRNLVAVEGPDSPLSKLQNNLRRELREQLREVRKEVQTISEKIAVSDAVSEVYELTSQKGFSYEEVLHVWLEAWATRHGDLAEQVGTEIGIAGTKKGDEVVTLDETDTFGLPHRFVVEAKARPMTKRNILKELDEAMENRAASAALAVFRSSELVKATVPFSYNGNKAIVVFDPEDGDDSALRLGYMWARWITRRDAEGSTSEGIDTDRIGQLVDEAQTALGIRSEIKKGHNQARKGIDQAERHFTAMTGRIDEILALISSTLGQ